MTAQGVLQCLLVIALLAGFADGMCININATTVSYEKCEYEGQTYEKGEEFQPNNCTWCKCDIDQDGSGDVTCTETACEMPMCENPVQEPDQCCPICNETSTTTTTPSPTCEYNGQIYQPGEQWKPERCEVCWCERDGSGQSQCAMYGCYGGSMCYDEEYIPGVDCCPRCPNGPNCYAGGTVLKDGETVTVPGQGECMCIITSSMGSIVKCFPIPSPPAPTPSPMPPIQTPTTICEHNGKVYQVGELFQKDPCTFCICETNSDDDCGETECPSPECVDPVTEPDQCCATCPNGPNCKHGDTVIASGETLITDSGEMCMCEPGRLEAVCTPAPSPSPSHPTTTPTPATQ